MAKAARKTSTADEIWFNDAVTLLATECGSPEFAQQLLVKGLQDGRVPWSYMDKDGKRVRGDTAFWNCKTDPLTINRAENRAHYSPLMPGSDAPDSVRAIKVSCAAARALLPSPPKKGEQPKRGAHAQYDVDGITRAAEAEARSGGVDGSQTEFIERVITVLENRGDAIPGRTWLIKHVGAIFNRAKAKARPGR